MTIVGVALFIFSCASKDDTNPVDPIVEVKFDSVEYVKATIDGASYSATPQPAIVTASGPGMLFFTFSSPNSAGVFILSATVPDTGTGTHTLGTGAVGSMAFTTFASGTGVTYTTSNGATGTLTIDKVDVTLKRMKGHFSGTVKNAAGDSKPITNGTFEVKW